MLRLPHFAYGSLSLSLRGKPPSEIVIDNNVVPLACNCFLDAFEQNSPGNPALGQLPRTELLV